MLILLATAPVWAGDEEQGPDEGARAVLTVQLGHSGENDSVMFSPDGRYLLTAGGTDSSARLWEVATGREIRWFLGHESRVGEAVFSPDASRVLTCSYDGTARIWDTASGRELLRFEGHEERVRAGAFTPDGVHALTVSKDKTARFWEIETGREVRRFDTPSQAVCVAMTPDGAHFIGGSYKVAWLIESATGRIVRTFEGHEAWIQSVAVSPDGTQLLTGSRDKTARLWDVATGREIRQLAGTPVGREMEMRAGIKAVAFSKDGSQALTTSWSVARIFDVATGRVLVKAPTIPTLSAAFSPDGKHFATGSFPVAHLWERATGSLVRTFGGKLRGANSITVSPDGASVVTCSGTAQLWEVSSGLPLWTFEGDDYVSWGTFSADGSRLLTGGGDIPRILDARTGREIKSFAAPRRSGPTTGVPNGRFSPDEKYILTASVNARDNTARLWEVATGKQVRVFDGHARHLRAMGFSADGSIVMTACRDGVVRLRKTDTGDEVLTIPSKDQRLLSAFFTPDGGHVVCPDDDTGRVWELASGREVRTLDGLAGTLDAVFSRDGKRLLTANYNDDVILWDFESGRELQRFRGHVNEVYSVAFTRDEKRAISSARDDTVRLWDVASGRELCVRVVFRDGTWAVFDRDGRYDASNGGDVEGLHWVIGFETVDLAQLKKRAYDPGLWAKHAGYSTEPLRKVSAADRVDLYPSVQFEPPGDDGLLVVDLTNRGGGIGAVRVLINGKEIEADARGAGFNADAKQASVAVDLRKHPSIKPGGLNTIEVVAWNKDGYLSSPRGGRKPWKAPGATSSTPPQLWAIVCGVSDYRGDAIDLRYAAKDAEDFARALKLSARSLFGEERTHVRVLSTSGAEGTTRPTRQALVDAFRWARAARPDDVLVVYLAGHGVSRAGVDEDFHYLLAEAASADLTDPVVRRQASLSSGEMTELIKAIPARDRQVLILDTCAAGRVIEKLTESRSVPSSQVRALDRVKDRTGMFVLAGCAADSLSFEASRYGQGLLTYSLLLGMRGGALREDEFVDVQGLFGFAADRVPQLARDVGGIQRPWIATPYGGSSFDIGRVPAELRKDIPLQLEKPVFVRPTFTDRRTRVVHALVTATNAVLREQASARGIAPLVFVDVAEMPEAYELTGTYAAADGTATVKGFVWLNGEEIGAFEVKGPAGDVEALARDLVKKAREVVHARRHAEQSAGQDEDGRR